MPPKAAAAKPSAPAAGAGGKKPAPSSIPGAAPGAKSAKRATAGAGADDRLSNKPAAAARDAPAESEGFKQLPGKPDKAAHDAEVAELSAQIEKLQKQSNDLRDKLAAKTASDPATARKKEIRGELETLRGDQAKLKATRDSKLAEIKALQDKLGVKARDLSAGRKAAPFKTVAEVDAQIKSLEKQVESGRMAVTEEKKTLQTISALKKTRKTVESFGSSQEGIDADKKKLDELRATLDHTESNAASEKYKTLKAELDGLSKQSDDAQAARTKVVTERDSVKAELDSLFAKRRDSKTAFREANDKYYQKVQEEKARRLEKARSERQAREDEKRAYVNGKLLEDASAPAYEREIEDCTTLIHYFRAGTKAAPPALTTAPNGAAKASAEGLAALPALSIRSVDAAAPAGAVAFARKEEDNSLFAGKVKKARAPKPANGAAPSGPSQALNLPMSTLSALLQFGISAPLSQADVPKTAEALEEKRKWYQDNQDRVTKERIAAAHAKIAAADRKAKHGDDAPATNGKAEASGSGATTAAAEEADVPAAQKEAPAVTTSAADESNETSAGAVSSTAGDAVAPTAAETEKAEAGETAA